MNKSCTVSVRRFSSVVRILVMASVLASGFQGAAVAQGVSVEQVAFQGDALDDGGQFSSFQSAVINNDGSVAFVGFSGSVASCSGNSVNLWKSEASVIQEPVCVGVFSNFGQDTMLNNNGDAIFMGNTWIDSESGGRHRVVSNVMAVPDMPGETFDRYFPPGMNDNGEVNFYASTTDINGPQEQGLWAEFTGEGSLESLVLEGDPAPGLSLEDAVFTTISQVHGAISNNGDVAFLARTNDPPPAGKQAQFGVWSVSRDGTVRKVVAQKDPMPGSAGNFFTTSSRPPSINAKGEVALVGITTISGEGGVWAERWNETSQQYELLNVIIAKTNIQISETTAWAPLEFHAPAINSNGDVGFVGCRQSSTSRVCGIVRATWNGSGYDHQAIVADFRIPGARRDGLGAGLVIGDKTKFNMNAQGLFAFQAQTDTHGPAWGLWGWRPDIGLRRVYLAGTPFRMPSGETRTVYNDITKRATLVATGGEDGRQKILNDSGLVVFVIVFVAEPPDTIRRQGVFIGDLNDTIFLDSLEWRWSPD